MSMATGFKLGYIVKENCELSFQCTCAPSQKWTIGFSKIVSLWIELRPADLDVVGSNPTKYFLSFFISVVVGPLNKSLASRKGAALLIFLLKVNPWLRC